MNELEQNAIRDALREIYNGRSLCVDESIAEEQIKACVRIVCKHLNDARQSSESATDRTNPK